MRKIFISLILILSSLLLVKPVNAAEITIPILKDTHVKERWGNTQHWTKTYLPLGFDKVYSNNIMRIYLNYDLSEIQASVDTIENASLELYQWRVKRGTPYYINVHEPQTSWEDTALTWYTQPEIRIVSENVEIQPDIGPISIDITALIRKQLADSSWRNGLALYAVIEDKLEPGSLFWSTECTNRGGQYEKYFCTEEQKPHLEINYTEIEEEIKGESSEITTTLAKIVEVASEAIDKTKEQEETEKPIIDSASSQTEESVKELPQLNSLAYPLGKLVGVTQWFGKTAFSNLHTGIDFGAVKDAVLAVADGTVEFAGWDNYLGPCNSGGNYIKIRHDNGLYSVYLHLESFAEGIANNARVSKGQQIGVSGNSGAYNCQPLGYHLHFEIRTGSSQATAVNPVDYIKTDWSTIPTLGYQRYPGRLSGENPHPLY